MAYWYLIIPKSIRIKTVLRRQSNAEDKWRFHVESWSVYAIEAGNADTLDGMDATQFQKVVSAAEILDYDLLTR